MCVNRHWQKVVREGKLLWKSVEVARMWDNGGVTGRKKGKYANMNRVVAAAEEVKFFGLGYTLSYQCNILRVVESSLKMLELPDARVNTDILSRLLASISSR